MDAEQPHRKDAAYWVSLGADARATAAQMKDAGMRQTMLRIAARYEALAERTKLKRAS